jgi:hypothetical protein
MVTRQRHNVISGQASNRLKPTTQVDRSYRKSDSRCDIPGHSDWICLDCPNPAGCCLHDREIEYATPTMAIAVSQIKKVSVYADY